LYAEPCASFHVITGQLVIYGCSYNNTDTGLRPSKYRLGLDDKISDFYMYFRLTQLVFNSTL